MKAYMAQTTENIEGKIEEGFIIAGDLKKAQDFTYFFKSMSDDNRIFVGDFKETELTEYAYKNLDKSEKGAFWFNKSNLMQFVKIIR